MKVLYLLKGVRREEGWEQREKINFFFNQVHDRIRFQTDIICILVFFNLFFLSASVVAILYPLSQSSATSTISHAHTSLQVHLLQSAYEVSLASASFKLERPEPNAALNKINGCHYLHSQWSVYIRERHSLKSILQRCNVWFQELISVLC